MAKSSKPTKSGASNQSGNVLTGDGTWPFQATIDGVDIVVKDIIITCFGGWGGGNIADPQDDGETASGVNTKNRAVIGVSIAMDGRDFAALAPKEHRALDGAPIPRLRNKQGLTAWHTQHFAEGMSLRELARNFEKRGSYRIIGGANLIAG